MGAVFIYAFTYESELLTPLFTVTGGEPAR